MTTFMGDASRKVFSDAREALERVQRNFSGFPAWASESRVLYVGAQLWVCRRCLTVRQWGEGESHEVGVVWLRCLKCKDVTSHSYAGVSRGFRE